MQRTSQCMLCWSFWMTQGILTISLYCTIFVPSFALRRSGFGCVLSFNVSGMQSNLNFSESQLDQTGKFAFIPGCNLMGCDIFQIKRLLSLYPHFQSILSADFRKKSIIWRFSKHKNFSVLVHFLRIFCFELSLDETYLFAWAHRWQRCYFDS